MPSSVSFLRSVLRLMPSSAAARSLLPPARQDRLGSAHDAVEQLAEQAVGWAGQQRLDRPHHDALEARAGTRRAGAPWARRRTVAGPSAACAS
jgi:hypothetical protein